MDRNQRLQASHANGADDPLLIRQQCGRHGRRYSSDFRINFSAGFTEFPRLLFHASIQRVASARCCSAAYFLTSSVIFIEQKCGPHMEQKCAVFAPSCGKVSS